MTVDLFIPCFIDQFHPEVAEATVKVLRKAGVEVAYNPNQTCCGQFSYNAGYIEEAKTLGDKFMEDFSGERMVVAPTASCVHFIKKRYPQLFYNTSNHLNFKRLCGNIYELTDFLVNVVHFDDFGAEFPAKVTYHDSCSALRGLGLGKEARQLLSKVKGLELIEMKQTELCCGSELDFSLHHETISLGMVSHKVQNAHNTGAEYVVSSEMSCLAHQRSYIEQNDLKLRVIHIAEILASGWE
ncbi:MAG: (Fe-S)-binding protein [Bacteroidales bacterium]|nr:(Fe-S)-binding protein [Bacteroidales bacterium]